MFEIQTNLNGSYRTVAPIESEVWAVHNLSVLLDHRRASESVRVLKDGVLMARKTPKGWFMHPDWIARADRALTRI